MRDDYVTLKQINYLLNKRCDFLLQLIEEIRYYLLECKEDKCTVDIDKILEKLD